MKRTINGSQHRRMLRHSMPNHDLDSAAPRQTWRMRSFVSPHQDAEPTSGLAAARRADRLGAGGIVESYVSAKLCPLDGINGTKSSVYMRA
jgi:hypothetical protein